MENIKKILGQEDEYILGRNKTNYFIIIPTSSKKIPLSDEESRSLMDYYIGASYRLREKTNESSIGQTLKALFSRQMYTGIVEFVESETIYRGLFGLESFDGSSDNISESEKSIDTKAPEFHFQLVQNSQLEEALQSCDKILLWLLSSALPGSQGCTSFSGFQNQGIPGDVLLAEQDDEGEEERLGFDKSENTYKSDKYSKLNSNSSTMSYGFNSFEQYHPPFRVKLFSPTKIEEMIKAPVKVSTNMMRIYESGVGNHSHNFSVFQDISKSLEILNIELEVRNLQINCKFIFANNKSKTNNTNYLAFKDYVEKRAINLKWIHTTQILEVYLFFENLRSQHDLESFIQTQNPQLSSLAPYSLKITIHHPLTAAIINDTKIQLFSDSKQNYIKTLYFSSEVKSNMFKYLNENNNIAFIHTRSFIDSRDINYKSFDINKHLVAQIHPLKDITDDSISSDSLTSSESESSSSSDLSMQQQIYYSNSDLEDVLRPNRLKLKASKQPEVSIFDVYREFLTASYAHSFIFTSYDVSSKQLSKISKSLHFPLNLESLVHSKTNLLFFIIAFNNVIAPHLFHNPTHSAWDLYL